MGIHLCLLLLFQTIWCSFIGAYPTVHVSMAQIILKDHILYKSNDVIQTIWQQEPATSCNIEKPPEKMLTNKKFLQFDFVPYLCVILFDASLRYLKLNTSHEIGFDISQEIISKFLPDTFCQKMKDNNWNTTIDGNKLWVSTFNNDMKNKYSCQRYCVSDVVNPLCAYALWIDLSVKKLERGSLQPLPFLAHELHSSEAISIPRIKDRVSSKEQVGASTKKQPHANNAQLLGVESSRPILNTVDSRPSPRVLVESQTSNAVTTRKYNDFSLAHQHLAAAGVRFASGQRPYLPHEVPHPVQTNIVEQAGQHMLTGNSHENSEQLKAGKTVASPIDASLSALGHNSDIVKTSDLLEPPARKNIGPDAHLTEAPKPFNKPIEPIVTQKPAIEGSASKLKNPPKEIQGEKQGVSEPALVEPTNTIGSTLSANPLHEAGETAPGVPLRAVVGNSPLDIMEEHNTEGPEQVSGEHTASANLVGGHLSANGGHSDTSNIVVPVDPPKPSVPETLKIPEPSEDKSDKVRVNTIVPEKNAKEVPGSTKGESTERKPVLEQIGKSELEAANQAVEGENDGRAISDDNHQPDNHEEQNDLDDGVADSQVENGDTLGGHEGDQTQDRDEAGIDTLDQEFPTEVLRYNQGDEDVPSRPDGSTKLSNNNNNEYLEVSDEDESFWSPAEQARIPQNDADAGFAHDRFVDPEDSHFFAYFMTMIVLCILGYLIFHNKQKILALALEGRVRKGTRRRPSTSGYRKLDSNLEEAVTSSCTGSSVTHVIY